MRTKKAIYNNIAAALLQTTILIFGLITPKLMIEGYGSTLNGLVSSTKQLVSYLKYIELGISAALVYTLYEPIAYKDFDTINPLVKRAKKEYEKISLIYIVGVLILSALYPVFFIEDIGYLHTFVIVFLIGLYGAVDFYTLSKYRVLLEADQKAYVLNLLTIVTTVMQNIISIVLILFNQPIIIVLIIPTIFLIFRSIALKIYLNIKYPQIDYKVKPSQNKLESRKDAFINVLSNTINLSLPIVIVSITVSLEMASVFSIYSMVYLGIAGIIGVFSNGMTSAFGNIIAKNEFDIFVKINNYFEFLLFGFLTILYSSALALITPFIKVYTQNITDFEYVYPIIGILFTVWSIIHNSRLPNQTIINATGKWNLITKNNIIQIVILFFGMLLLGFLFGVNGILIGMIISSLYKTFVLMNVANKKILKTNNKVSIKRFIRIFVVILIVNIPIIIGLINIEPSNFNEWILIAIPIIIWSSLMTLLANLIFDFSTIKMLYNRYVKRLFKKLK